MVKLMVRPDSRGLILEGIASSLARPTQLRRDVKPRPRSEAKRAKIVEVAIRHFADRGYNAARVEDIAAQLGIAKGSVFQHFKSKDGLFFEAYKKAVMSFPKYLQVPAELQQRGFFEVLRYWLGRTEYMVRDNLASYRIYLVGNYGTDLALRKEINRFLVTEDPYGWREFVSFGIQRGDLRSDLDVDMMGSILEWTMDRFQDALLTEELDPGLFRKTGHEPEKKEARIEQFVELLRRAIGPDTGQAQAGKA
ncbi:MAG: TetR/AcrR family transcriptional regulator [Terriglobales bacterium]